MPIYEYSCSPGSGGCGIQFEEMRKITDPPTEECPKCGAKALKRIYSAPGLIFKGSGFYVNDYGKDSRSS